MREEGAGTRVSGLEGSAGPTGREHGVTDAWDTLVRHELYGGKGCLARLGGDRACCNPARLSRLPSHFRQGKPGEAGRRQRLLYLNPVAR